MLAAGLFSFPTSLAWSRVLADTWRSPRDRVPHERCESMCRPGGGVVSKSVVELDGQRYVWNGSRWYRDRDFLTPPSAILRRLDALLPNDAVKPLKQAPEQVLYSRSLIDLWPDPLAAEWMQRYPHLFDEDDFRCTRKQPTLHFWEWYAAVHLFEREGAYSLVEKYVYSNHPVKAPRLAAVLSESQRDALKAICRSTRAEPPDLFVYMPGTYRFWFAEVKVPPDRVRPNQAANHEAITRELGVRVQILSFNRRLANGRLSRESCRPPTKEPS